MALDDWKFLSIGARYLVNLHALNNEGTAGNLTRLRRVSYLVPDGNGSYKTIYANVVSGQSVAHAIQAHVAELARAKSLPVCQSCTRHAFIKHGNKDFIEIESEDFKKALQVPSQVKGLAEQVKVIKQAEKTILSHCVVEDIGGFLIAEKNYMNVRRESTFHVSFFAPTFDHATLNYIESLQFARHDVAQSAKESETSSQEQEKTPRSAQGQMLFVQEVAGGVYGLRVDVDLQKIGRLAAVGGPDDFQDNNREERVLVALEAVKRAVAYMQFGAKLSRFLPIQELLDVAMILSDGIPISSPFRPDFVDKSRKRAETHEKLGGKAKFFHYDPKEAHDVEEVFQELFQELGLA